MKRSIRRRGNLTLCLTCLADGCEKAGWEETDWSKVFGI